MSRKKRIAINTGGGDAPGLNAVIRSVVLSAVKRGWEVFGIRRGYEGLFEEDGVLPMDERSVSGITHLGGTVLGTTNRGNPLEYPVTLEDGTTTTVDRTLEILDQFDRRKLDALIAIGGDGSPAYRVAPFGTWAPGDRCPQDDRQRPRRHRGDVRVPHRSADCFGRDRQAPLDRGVAPPRDGGRGHGARHRMDRPLRRRVRNRRRDPDPGDPLQRWSPSARRSSSATPTDRSSRSSWSRRARRPWAVKPCFRRQGPPAWRHATVESGERVAGAISRRTGRETREITTWPPPTRWPAHRVRPAARLALRGGGGRAR